MALSIEEALGHGEVVNLVPALRESIVVRLANLNAESAAEYAAADVLAGHADDHRAAASRLQFQAEQLAAKLEEMH